MVSLFSTPAMLTKNEPVDLLSHSSHGVDDDNDATSVQLTLVNVEASRRNVNIETADDSHHPGTTEDSLAASLAAIKLRELTDDVANETTQESDSKDAAGVVGYAGSATQICCLHTESENVKCGGPADPLKVVCAPVMLATDTTTSTHDGDGTAADVQVFKSSDDDEQLRNDAVETKNENGTETQERLAVRLDGLKLKWRGPDNGISTSGHKFRRPSPHEADSASEPPPSNMTAIRGTQFDNANHLWHQFNHSQNVTGATTANYHPTMQYVQFSPNLPTRPDCRFAYTGRPVYPVDISPYHPNNFLSQVRYTYDQRAPSRDVTAGQPPTCYNGYACHTAVPPTSTTVQPPASGQLAELSVEDIEQILGVSCGSPMPLSVNHQHGYDVVPQQSAELHQMRYCGPPNGLHSSDVTPHLQVVAAASCLAQRISLQVSPVSDTSLQHESSVSPCDHSSTVAAVSTPSDYLDVDDITIYHSGYSSGGSCGRGSPSASTIDSADRSPSYSDPCRISPLLTDQPNLEDESSIVSNDLLDQLSSNNDTSSLHDKCISHFSSWEI